MSREGQSSNDPAIGELDRAGSDTESSVDSVEQDQFRSPFDAYALAELALRYQRTEAMIERARRQSA